MKRPNLELSHIRYSILFTTLLYLVSNAINIDKITKWFLLGDSINYSALIAFLVFGLCFFTAFFILLAHRWTIKPLSIFFILASTTATYFIAKYNVAIDRSMIMNTVYTDSSEVKSLLSVRMLPYLFFLTVVPILLVASTKITFQRATRYLPISLITSFSILFAGVGLVYAEYTSIHRAANISNKYILHSLVPVNIISGLGSVLHRTSAPLLQKNKKKVEITGKITAEKDLLVVLTIGESARKKSFSLYGYDRVNTNPVLSKYQDLHLLTGKARLGTTLLALPEILEKDGIKLPAFTSKLGVDTACLVNFILYDNCDAVGEIPVSNCGHGGKCYDEDVLPLLDNNLESYQGGYRFVVLHLGGGSHGPMYKDRHPPEFQRFKPQCLDADVVNHCTVEQLYNSYDNTILYTDYVLGEVIQRLDDSEVPYVFIYLSDHGESLLENDLIFHGMPPGIPLPPEQAEIPLIVKSSLPISIVAKDEYLQNDVFDTVLALFSIESKTLNVDRVFIELD